jgi:hypothetical protein
MDKQQLKRKVGEIKRHWDYIIDVEKKALEWDKNQLVAQHRSLHLDKHQIENWKLRIKQHQDKIREYKERKKSEIEQAKNLF